MSVATREAGRAHRSGGVVVDVAAAEDEECDGRGHRHRDDDGERDAHDAPSRHCTHATPWHVVISFHNASYESCHASLYRATRRPPAPRPTSQGTARGCMLHPGSSATHACRGTLLRTVMHEYRLRTASLERVAVRVCRRRLQVPVEVSCDDDQARGEGGHTWRRAAVALSGAEIAAVRRALLPALPVASLPAAGHCPTVALRQRPLLKALLQVVHRRRDEVLHSSAAFFNPTSHTTHQVFGDGFGRLSTIHFRVAATGRSARSFCAAGT